MIINDFVKSLNQCKWKSVTLFIQVLFIQCWRGNEAEFICMEISFYLRELVLLYKISFEAFSLDQNFFFFLRICVISDMLESKLCLGNVDQYTCK